MISVLFAARDSVYKTLPDVDVWDEDRDAMNWPGGNPGIFHPPCRLWSMLAHFSTAPRSEKELAIWSVRQVQHWRGVLEHPAHSKLWSYMKLPRPGEKDSYGFTFSVDQFWFGHPGVKRTWLYICGTTAKNLPEYPIRIGHAENVFAGGSRKYVPGSRHGGIRSATPIEFAKWLIKVAGLSERGQRVRIPDLNASTLALSEARARSNTNDV
jgi:hypothetical protein